MTETLFKLACRRGYLSAAKFLRSRDPSAIDESKIKQGFINACDYGHLKTAQWLHSIHNTMDSVTMKRSFVYASENGHLKTAKWLFSQDLTVKDSSLKAFERAHNNKHRETAKWLYMISDDKKDMFYGIMDKKLEMDIAKLHIAAQRIKSAWLKCYYSPYTEVGIKRLNKEYDELVESGIVCSA